MRPLLACAAWRQHRARVAQRFALAAACGLLVACASAPPATLAWNPALHVEGAPPVPQALLEDLQCFTRIAGHDLVEWHPTRPELLVAHRPSNASVPHLYRVRSPQGSLLALTRGPEAIRRGQWEPRQGRYLVYAASRGGDEAEQLHRLDPETGRSETMTAPGRRHALLAWLHRQSKVLVASVPLDRTAASGSRAQIETWITRIDPLALSGAERVATLSGTGWYGAAVSPDDRWLALGRSRSSTDSELWLIDLSGQQRSRRLLPLEGAPAAAHRVEDFGPDGHTLYFRSDRSSEFLELMRMDLASGAVARLSAGIPWDLSQVELSPDGRRLAAIVNAGGRESLQLLDLQTRRWWTPPGLPQGSIESAHWHPHSGALAIQLDSARGPGQVHVLAVGNGAAGAWTQPEVPDCVDPKGFAASEVFHWKAADGLALSGWLTRPDPRRFPGPRPVLMLVHGGSASQSKDGWLGRYHYLVEQLGIAVLRPNVRGSSGFGKAFLALDDGVRREDSVRDLGALLDQLQNDPGLDSGRVVVMGGSYGGYMSLAASVHFADRIAGAIDVVGISSFVTFLERTESYRRDLRRTEYGDERDPAMRAFLQSISPLDQVDRITKPLLVVQGRNDPRVPWTEAEQIVRRLQQRGQPVWYLLADNEGHGFVRRENADAYFATVVQFLQQTLGR